MLAGATELKPLQQGKLSALCGLYSILNCIQLALYPRRLSRPELKRIYLHAIAHLSRRRQLIRVLGIGMEYERWIELQNELIAYVNDAYRMALNPTMTLTGTAAFNRQRAIDRIKRNLCRSSHVLAVFGGLLNHYSVICGYTEQRLVLFDSSGLRWIQADNLGLGESSRRSHWISADYTLTMADDW